MKNHRDRERGHPGPGLPLPNGSGAAALIGLSGRLFFFFGARQPKQQCFYTTAAKSIIGPPGLRPTGNLQPENELRFSDPIHPHKLVHPMARIPAYFGEAGKHPGANRAAPLNRGGRSVGEQRKKRFGAIQTPFCIIPNNLLFCGPLFRLRTTNAADFPFALSGGTSFLPEIPGALDGPLTGRVKLPYLLAGDAPRRRPKLFRPSPI